jgi:flagellar protein FliS
MMQMYEYMNHRLIEANINNDVKVIEEVEGYTQEFRDTWKQVIQINRQKQFTGDQA